MTSSFHRNLFLAFGLVASVSHVVILIVLLQVIYQGEVEREGKDTARLAGVAARTINERVRDTARSLNGNDIIAPAVYVLDREKPMRILLADSSGAVLAGDRPVELSAELYASPYSIVTSGGKSYLAASARIEARPSADVFWSVVILRDMEEVVAAYYVMRDQLIILSSTLLALVIVVAFKIAQHFAAPVKTLQEGLELMVGANPDHRIELPSESNLRGLADHINRLADASSATKTELEREVAEATRTMAFEKEKLASILFSLAEGVIVCDRELRVILCNKAARGILPTTWKPARRGGGIYAFLDAARLKPLVDAVGDKPRAMKQGTFTLANGVMVQATTVAVGEGDERNYIFLLRDITQLVSLDRQRNRAVNDMLQDLRSPLSSLLSFTDILLDYPGLDESRKTHFLEIMREEAGRLREKVDELQAKAEATLSPIEWPMEEVEIGTLVRQEVESLQPLAEERTVQLVGKGESVLVRGDVLSLQQLVRRMLEFCISYSVGCGFVDAEWGYSEDGWGRFSVSYSGRSLSSEEIEGIFENPLYIGSSDREDLPTSREVASIREIIKQHGGEIWAKNLERGATLAFILPGKTGAAAKPNDSDDDTVGKQITALLGDGSFYDFRLTDDSPGPARSSALFSELSYVVLDLETTGLSPQGGDEIVSIAGIRIEHGEIVKEDYFYTLVNPRRSIPASSTRVHGITDDMVANQPLIEEIAPKFLDFQGDSILGGHFVSFDISFLEPKIASIGAKVKTSVALDTMLLSYALFKDLEAYNLEDLANYLGVKVVARHTALGDAYVTAQILIQLFKVMEGRGIRTLGEALHLQGTDSLAGFLRRGRTGTGSELP